MPIPLSTRYRNALVTGASSGLGRAFATALAREGITVWGTSRDPARVRAPVRGIRLDLAEGAAAAAAVFQKAETDSGGIGLLVHNAGSGVFGRFGSAEFDQWRRQFDELAMTGAAIVHAALRAMNGRRRGTIVCVTSMAAEFPIPFMPAYNAAKAAQSALAESLMLETAGSEINVIDFRAGDYRTGFNEAMTRIPDPETDAAWRRSEALMRAAPDPLRAAADLLRVLRRGRSGIVRSGGIFQARVAPLLARFAPRSWQLAMIRRYYGIS